MKTENIDLIIKFEGFSSVPYLCPASIPTIGYGSTRYADGTKVKLVDMAIAEDEAIELLKATLANYEKCINKNVKVPLSQNQFDSLVSFVYNVGCGNFEKSTLLKKLNKEDYIGASDEFVKWNKANGVPLRGLTARRLAERDLFLS
jgi:lysozyme